MLKNKLLFCVVLPMLFVFVTIFFPKSGFCYTSCVKGEIYKDSQKRFEVTCPSNEIDFDILGIAFKDSKNYSYYLVRALDTPPVNLKKELTIENVLSDIKSSLSAKAEIEVLKQEKTTYDNHEAMNFIFVLKTSDPMYYYTRLIRSDNYVFWIYMAMPSGPDSLIVTNENEAIMAPALADKFLNSLKILK